MQNKKILFTALAAGVVLGGILLAANKRSGKRWDKRFKRAAGRAKRKIAEEF